MEEFFRAADIRGMLHMPEKHLGDTLVLTHGAGSNANAPLLVELARAFEAAGCMVLRYDLPFRQARRTGPPLPSGGKADREGLRNACEALRPMTRGRMFLGGHSYGGRQATMAAAEDPSIADGLVLLSYPLHPPKKPLELRTEHLKNLRTPSLFVHGSKDGFGKLDEMRAALALIPAKTQLLEVHGAGHDLKGLVVKDVVRAVLGRA
jgi:uncharacterized protein